MDLGEMRRGQKAEPAVRPQSPSPSPSSDRTPLSSILVLFIPAFIGLGAFLIPLATGTALASADPWEQVHRMLRESTGRIDSYDAAGDQDGVCSAFSIHEEEAYWMTAAHCLSATVLVEGQIAWTVYEDPKTDLAVLMVPGISRQALRPREDLIPVGAAVAAFGFANGWPIPHLRTGHVAIADIEIKWLPGQRVTVIDTVLIAGMSGGPMVDRSGRVVSVSQMGSSEDGAGLGRVMSEILNATRQFWEY